MKSIDIRLDKAFRDFIKRRDPRCVVCGRQTDHCAHLFAGRHASTKWDTRCAFGLCVGCHTSQHQDKPSLLRDWFIETEGQSLYDVLTRLNNMTARWADEDKRNLLTELK